ncbi:MAG: N-acetylglucosamine-6-phosphate deacetylase [Pyrinomonadaceae bacterium]|nr:N-acetylglucosamine-6-phosphate deacetylase [Pyrinomonadaceae bacterium]MBP9109996.1 N-acetylglucosamine-6-phosphate deacetylase [Pyrinomonadaceae bacterium]
MVEITIKNAMVAGGDSMDLRIGVKKGLIDVIDRSRVQAQFSDLFVTAGFIDVHNHGALGFDVNEADVDGLLKVSAFLAKNGVTAWMPTLVPDSDENYRRVIHAIDELMLRQVELPVAQAVGVHYEGVFANEKMCGALRPEYFRSGQWSAAGGQLPKLDRGVHMTTLAPEIDGGIEMIRALVADGWVVSIGHTRADVETLDRAYAAGARHMTHFFNAMTGVHHREIGVAGWGLANDGVTFDIIADGVHVHPDILGVACRSKSPDKVSLISDSVAPTGLGDGEFELWGETVTVKNGRTQNERGSIAGSVCTMLDCVKTMRSIGFSELEVSQMASTNPAKLLGLEDRGSIEIGKRADLVGLNADGKVAFTMIGGELVPK